MKTVLGRGMGKLFENSVNFSGLSKKVQVGEVLVKFKITVNEEGATVASATVEFSFRSSRPDDPAMFHCNHPFEGSTAFDEFLVMITWRNCLTVLVHTNGRFLQNAIRSKTCRIIGIGIFHKLVDSWVMITFELDNDGKHSSVMRPDSKQECLLKGFDLDSHKPEQWIGDS
ncbi:hypothetical protein quinque_002391 [Culex quinquefasciatus]|uniref:Serpin domain-containing protein n=1 Tax=Culex pipiens pipiens TaxID=38569 RepID=A0ABD1CGF2_CULPP